ncbi:MAG TPA: hypothetical protein VLA19_29020 [Herpetosiphonaceae bacterium]|nr:hypothetical protein [Herpetosiphonaceae bacterium]
MPTVAEVWNACDEGVWLRALERYWDYLKPADLEIVKELEPLDVEHIRRLDSHGWYDFLFHKYFQWKYTAPNRLATRRNRLRRYIETGTLATLYQIKEQLLTFDQENIKEGLRTGLPLMNS